MTSDVIVAGAGPGGLAAAACLRRVGLRPLVVERSQRIGDGWRGHYDRLRLHTTRRLSGLPGLPIPRRCGRWVARDDVAAYLERYASHHRLDVRTGVEVRRVDQAPGGWVVRSGEGDLDAPRLVVATGYNRVPHLPEWPGREGFAGRLLHASEYRNPEPFRGRDVLVVGTGNTGAEVAADLAEGGADRVWIAVRTPPSIFPRAAFGIPTQVVSMVLTPLPPAVVDPVATGLQRVLVGDLSRYGLPTSRRPYSQFLERDVLAILDVGLVGQVKTGRVEPVAGVRAFEGPDVLLADDRRLRPAVVIAATGYRRGLEPLVGHLGVLRPDGRPIPHGPRTHPRAPGLYFIGFTNPPTGNLRELGIDARKIARAVRRDR